MSPTPRTPPLLTVSAPYGTIELRGRHAPPAGIMAGVEIPSAGTLAIGSDHTPITDAAYTNVAGEQQPWSPTVEHGPVFFEETTYQLFAAGTEHPPQIQHRDPLFNRNITTHQRQRVSAGTFNFGRQVGHTTIDARFGPEVLHLSIEVVPTKIDYATDYRHLRRDIEATAHGLALAYLRTTHQHGSVGDQLGSEIDWLTILRQESIRLQQAIERINTSPHRHLTRELHHEATHKIKRPDPAARKAVIQGKGSGGYYLAANIGPIRESVPRTATRTTLDTPEHRWLALQLSQLRHRLRTLSATLDAETRAAAARPVGLRHHSQRAEVDQMLRRVDQMLNTRCIQAASRVPQPGPPSLTLLTAPGYREGHHILTMLRLALNLEGDALELQTKDIHDLYEIWSFLEVVKIVAGATHANVDPSSLIHHYSTGLRIGLRAGNLSYIHLPAGSRHLTLSYNRTYPGETGNQRPDIVIRIQEEGHPNLIVVFDAKYRVDATTRYREAYGAAGPPIDAINALHRYRDAIVTNADTPQTMRPVVRGAALFPLTEAETRTYHRSSLYQSLESLGIGALPFLPGNTELAERWLGKLLALPPDKLSWNGPPGPSRF